MNNNFKKLLQNQTVRYVLIGLVSIAVIYVFSLFFSKNEEKGSDNIYTYSEFLESKLSNNLKAIKGVGDVSVMITFSSDKNYEIAVTTSTKSVKDNTETVTEPVLKNGEVVIINEKHPEIVGVLIVADGALNYGVYNRILDATKTLLNIDERKIEIMPKN